MSIRANVDARRLDQEIRLERKVETRDDIGGVVESWIALITTRAAVDSVKVSAERPGSDGIVVGLQLTFWIRSDVVRRFDLSPINRIRWNDKVFNIDAVVDNQLGGRLSALYATTGLNRG